MDSRDSVAALTEAALRRVEDPPPDARARMAAALAFLLAGRSGARLAVRGFDPDAARDGYTTAGSVVEASVEDRPLLTPTLLETLRARGLAPAVLLIPIVGVERDAHGALVAIEPARAAARRETLLHVELDVRLAPADLADLVAELRAALTDALAATDDHEAMRAQLAQVADGLRPADPESAELLRWLLDGRFVFLGSRGSGEPSLGILRDDPGLAEPVVPPDRHVTVTLTRRVATVARRCRMTLVAARRHDGGEHHVLGLLTARAAAEPAASTPVLRALFASVLKAEDVVEDSDDGRQLRTLFETFPRHELFAVDPEVLRRTLVALFAARRRQLVRLLALPDPASGTLTILVTLPRERYVVGVRQAMSELFAARFAVHGLDERSEAQRVHGLERSEAQRVHGLERSEAQRVRGLERSEAQRVRGLERSEAQRVRGIDERVSLDEQGNALLSFTLALPDVEVGLDELEGAVARLVRTFAEDVAEALAACGGPGDARRRSEEFVRRLPAGYTETVDAATAADDLEAVEALADGEMRVAVRVERRDPPELRRVRIYKAGEAIELSDFLPVLENLGLTVTDQVQHRLAATQARPAVSLHDFAVRADRDLPAGIDLDVERDGRRVGRAVVAALRGETESDSLDRLVLAAGLDWSDVVLLRAYRQYRRQVGTTFSPRLTDDALVGNPAVAAALVALFAARFDPTLAGEHGAVQAARERLRQTLDAVTQFEEDRILRGFAALVDATLRTNRHAATRRDSLALKIASDRVPEMPDPVPFVEVFVSGRGVQGIHLRGGPVARGGLRWSDRREDLRTEVLGLLKAQMVKNALIVPTGAKGGFVLTRPPAEAAALRAAVRSGYETFVRGLLDVTDNIVDGAVVAPVGVRRHDRDDPYLVVAADRGTATFSDVANAIAAEYDFWLGDAFASGGSHGYDHKAMGITARGAWVAVRRHFRSLDVDVQAEPVRIVGVGDMSGDVFGNGVLLSSAIRLVGAFDHRHVFLDPDPDPAVSYAERSRLAALPRSSWADYDQAALSPGGGVWSRAQKAIPLAPEARALLRVEDESLSPPELIRALLRAPADLLFAGGIGTFVRATGESDLDVGDRANDSVRVTAADLGARVVGEGGNLALTQRARIQYARRGGRCNTDAIDNAGGVDTSDREVNLKILLRAAIDAGDLDRGERDPLLAAMADDVAAAVLRDVDRQIAALDWEATASPALMDAYEALMAELAESGRLGRDVEALPDTTEMARRRDAGAGLTRPELAVLLGYAKVDHADRLLASTLPDAPELTSVLTRYFPPDAVERFGHLLGAHRLRRELVATVVANDLVNHMGVSYPSRTARELGTSHAEVAGAWWAACEVADAWSAWRSVEGLAERLTPALQVELAAEVDRLVDTLTRGYVRVRGDGGLAAVVARDRPAFLDLAKSVEDAVPRARRQDRARRVERWLDLGIPSEVAGPLGSLRELSIVPDVAIVAAETGREVRQIGEVFWRLSEALPFDDLGARLGAFVARGSWQYWQRRGLTDELREVRRSGASLVVRAHPASEPADAVAAFLTDRTEAERRVRTLLAALDREDSDIGLDGIAVVVRVLRDLLTWTG